MGAPTRNTPGYRRSAGPGHVLQVIDDRADAVVVMDSATSARRASPSVGGPALWALAAVVTAALVVFDVVTALAPRPEPVDLWDTWVYGLVMVGAAGIALLRAASVRSERALWGTLGLAIALYAGGDWMYTLWIQNLDPEPYPSLSDAWWIAFYVVAALAVVGLVRAELPTVPVSVWLDGLVAGLGAATLAAALSFDTIARAGAQGPALEAAVNLAYPLADLVLLGIATAAMAVQRWRVGPRWILLGAGLVAFSAGDTAYVYAAATDEYVAGGLLDTSWPTGAVLMALAALTPAPRRMSARRETAAVVVAPVLLATAALGLLVAQQPLGITGLSLLLAGLTVLAALARIAVTVREVSALATTRAQASTDELTGLANRRQFFEVLTQVTARRSSSVAVAMVDLDRFKEVNDSLGHDAGDALLRAVAHRLRAALGERSLVARLGGDEFAVIVEAGPGAPAVLERLRAALAEVCAPVPVGELRLRPSASAGVALSHGRLTDVDALMRSADAALYRAKGARGSVELAGTGDESGRDGEQQRVVELRAALDDGSLVVHVQPQLDLATDEVTTLEALPRLVHPRHGLLGPESFASAAQQAGLMPTVTRRVLDAALLARAGWAAGGRELRVSVALSRADLMDEDLVDVVAVALDRHAVPHGALELEIEEGCVATDLAHATHVLAALRGIGVSVALDGFDVESSSLGPLNLLPLDTLKLVGTFGHGHGHGHDHEREREPAVARRSCGAVASVVSVARSRGLRVVAVGAHDAAARHLAGSIGCHAVQAHPRAGALALDDVEAWLEARTATRTSPSLDGDDGDGAVDRERGACPAAGHAGDPSTATTRWAETREIAPDATSTTTTEPASTRSG